ncbi:MAG: thiamine-phosphate kinase [Lentimicrobiaceae bacterium]|jgi:thiamine-monophosphate kinase|nr:thiamine-phosphate kinase [Lentimicrobiaceae bacterium]
MNDEKISRTDLSELGEFGLIDHLLKDITATNPSTIKAAGDDAAVIDHKDEETLVSVDLLVEGVHFDLTYTPLKHLGYKAAVVNFSDIVAMNGTPTQIVVGIAVSNRFSIEALDELYAGIKLACQQYHVDLVGGDTTSSKSGLMLSITAIGKAKSTDIVYRSGASEHDLLCVSGDLGAAYMGLLLLEREKAAFIANPNMQPDLQGNDYILERQLKPEARIDIIEILRKNDVKPTSMIDISDGLASEILHLCKESSVGCRIYEEKIPIDIATVQAAEAFHIIPSVAALNGGEDYELLFTIKQSDFEKIQAIDGIHIIGHITAEKDEAIMISNDGQAITLRAQGWDALRTNSA